MSMRQLKISNSITTRESLSMNKYMVEISKFKLLSPEDEVLLCCQAKKGDRSALDRLVRANLRFVVSVAKQYQGQGLSLPDLVNEGNIGLIQAARKFDETRGFRFISFAVWHIRQSIITAIAQQAQLVRLPMHKTTMMRKIKKVAVGLEQELGRAPGTDEIAEALQIPVEEINELLCVHQKPVSLDNPLSEEEDSSSMMDTLANPAAEQADQEIRHRQSLHTELHRQLSVLTDRQKETLFCFFGIGADHPMNLDEIARKYDVTTERVRQIKDAALEKLRACCQVQLLRSYL